MSRWTEVVTPALQRVNLSLALCAELLLVVCDQCTRTSAVQ